MSPDRIVEFELVFDKFDGENKLDIQSQIDTVHKKSS